MSLDNVEFQHSDFDKSNHSMMGMQCVEVAHKEGVVGVRDSKNPEGPVLKYTQEEWEAFVKGVKDGEFDFS